MCVVYTLMFAEYILVCRVYSYGDILMFAVYILVCVMHIVMFVVYILR